MALKVSKLQILHGLFARCVLLRFFLLISAFAVYPLIQFVSNVDIRDLLLTNSSHCASYKIFAGQNLKPMSLNHLYHFKMPSLYCYDNLHFTSDMFAELMDMKFLNPGDKVLCVGEGSAPTVSTLRELGFIDAVGVDRHPFFSLVRKGFIYNLSFEDNSFDFVFSKAFDKVSIPALFTFEVERVLRPGGVGVMLMRSATLNPTSLVKIAAPLSAFLKSSNVIHMHSIDSFTLVVFKKGGDDLRAFKHYGLPDECPSVIDNKPYMDYLEPLVDEKFAASKRRFSYLSKSMNVSKWNQLVYIDIGAGKFINSSIANWFIPFYPKQSLPFTIYALDHDKSVFSSYVGKTGITFIHYPGLAGKWAMADIASSSELGSLSNDASLAFDFLVWFKKTVTSRSFVVLKMDAEGVGFKLLHELFESGAICLVDELFLHCRNSTNQQDAKVHDCFQLFKALRNGGIYVHQWFGD